MRKINMVKFKIKIEAGTAYVYTPFSEQFNAIIKRGGGRWDTAKKAWSVPSEKIEDARGIMRNIYGRDDRPTKCVSVQILFSKKYIGEEITFFGRTIAYANQKSEIKIGYGIILEGNKSFEIVNGKIEIAGGTKIIIRDVPVNVLAQAKDMPCEIQVQIIHDQYDRQMLEAEKKSLIDRLAEIEKIIQKMGDEKNEIF